MEFTGKELAPIAQARVTASGSMRTIRGFLAGVLLLSMTCAFCKTEMSPITEGTVSYGGSNSERIERSLAPEQIRALTEWINRSNQHWGRCFITPPGGPWSVKVRHADGTTSSLSLLKFRDEPVPSTILAAHLNGSNLSDQPCALQKFDPSDIDSLRAILAIPKT